VVVNNVHDTPDLFLTETTGRNHWITVALEGTRSNRSAIGARVRAATGSVVQTQEVRGGGSYNSQNDLRVHFGLAEAAKVERLEVRWPSGLEEEWRDLAVDRILAVKEGSGKARDRQ
jgi:enediyne biosynthesis protein E4